MPTRTPTIPASPEVLKWAREQMNLSVAEAAQRLGITVQELTVIETGSDTTRTPAAVVRKMESVYKRKRSVLLLPSPPPARGKVALRTGRGTRPSESTLLAIRDVRRVQRFVTDLVELDPELFPLQTIGDHDPWMVAYAAGQGWMIVTEEKRIAEQWIKGKRPKIPDAADAYNVKCLKMADLIRDEGWLAD